MLFLNVVLCNLRIMKECNLVVSVYRDTVILYLLIYYDGTVRYSYKPKMYYNYPVTFLLKFIYLILKSLGQILIYQEMSRVYSKTNSDISILLKGGSKYQRYLHAPLRRNKISTIFLRSPKEETNISDISELLTGGTKYQWCYSAPLGGKKTSSEGCNDKLWMMNFGFWILNS